MNYPNRQGYQPNYKMQQPKQIKTSGATYTKMRNGKFAGMYMVTAWRKTKNGLLTAKAFPVSDVEHKSERGNYFIRYVVEVSNASVGTVQKYWTLMNVKSQKISINELSLVISPNGSGYTRTGKRVTGYFGSNYKR